MIKKRKRLDESFSWKIIFGKPPKIDLSKIIISSSGSIQPVLGKLK